MTADGCPGCSGPMSEIVVPRLKASEVGEMVCLTCGTDHDDPGRVWQERHADLAVTLRTILAMCALVEQHDGSGRRDLARSVRGVIEDATEWPGR